MEFVFWILLVVVVVGLVAYHDREPDTAEALYERGNAKFIKGDNNGAIADFNKVINLKPDDVDAYLGRGLAKQLKGDDIGAIADFDKVIRLKPDDAEAYFGRGNAQNSKGDKSRAKEDYQKALSLAKQQNNANLITFIQGTIDVQQDIDSIDPYDAEAYYNLGNTYILGQGVAKNDKQAVKYYRLAAEQGFAAAQTSLGLMYRNGEGVGKNDKQAVKYYSLAAEQGDANAQTYLGVMYVLGQGVPKNEQIAYQWVLLAAEQGDERSKAGVKSLEESLTPEQRAAGRKAAEQWQTAFDAK